MISEAWRKQGRRKCAGDGAVSGAMRVFEDSEEAFTRSKASLFMLALQPVRSQLLLKFVSRLSQPGELIN